LLKAPAVIAQSVAEPLIVESNDRLGERCSIPQRNQRRSDPNLQRLCNPADPECDDGRTEHHHCSVASAQNTSDGQDQGGLIFLSLPRAESERVGQAGGISPGGIQFGSDRALESGQRHVYLLQAMVVRYFETLFNFELILSA
jgi:hypothetical protein